MHPEISEQRLTADFLELTASSSESLDERKSADLLTKKLQEIGFSVIEDDAGQKLGGNAGNLYGFLKGSLPGEPLLLSAHMDTVKPGKNKQTVLHDDGTFTSDGTTVLGADDAAGLAEILEAIRSVRKANIPHRDIEVLFPVAEEIGLLGSSVFDFSRIRAKEAYVLDMSGEVGSAAVRAPSLISFSITVTGMASHAGFAPENGIHAIAAAAAAIAQIPQGRVEDETTCNIGTITGGTAKNIVPEQCVCTGEVRSFSHENAVHWIGKIRDTFSDAVSQRGAAFTMKTKEHFHSYSVSENTPVVKRFQRACETLGLAGTLRSTFGGSDNHIFLKAGISGIVISCGMQRVHSTEEHITVYELMHGAALIAEMIQR